MLFSPLRSPQVFVSTRNSKEETGCIDGGAARPWLISPSAIPFDTPVTGTGGAGQKPFGRCPNRQGTFYEGASLISHYAHIIYA